MEYNQTVRGGQPPGTFIHVSFHSFRHRYLTLFRSTETSDFLTLWWRGGPSSSSSQWPSQAACLWGGQRRCVREQFQQNGWAEKVRAFQASLWIHLIQNPKIHDWCIKECISTGSGKTEAKVETTHGVQVRAHPGQGLALETHSLMTTTICRFFGQTIVNSKSSI